jgi:RND superfamily putative drug exporter
MIQEKEIHGAVEGTRKALALTGGTITSCGLIMAGTFATLMLAGLNTLFQIGFALAFGVLLDTFIVRPILVPAFTVLIWKKLEGAETAKIHRLRYREKLRKAI